MKKRIAVISNADVGLALGVASLTLAGRKQRGTIQAKPALLTAHENYIERWERDGGRTVKFTPPCKCPALKVTVPPLRGGTWDSLMTCPHCKALFMTVRTPNRVTTGEVIPQ